MFITLQTLQSIPVHTLKGYPLLQFVLQRKCKIFISNYAIAKTLIMPKTAIAVTVLSHMTLELPYQEQRYCKTL